MCCENTKFNYEVIYLIMFVACTGYPRIPRSTVILLNQGLGRFIIAAYTENVGVAP